MKECMGIVDARIRDDFQAYLVCRRQVLFGDDDGDEESDEDSDEESTDDDDEKTLIYDHYVKYLVAMYKDGVYLDDED